jgi:phenylalanyl-tRNA synthetase alpha chain
LELNELELEQAVKSLHPLEIRLLLRFGGAETEKLDAEALQEQLGYNVGQCNQSFSWLAGKGLIAESERCTRIEYAITELGREYRRVGTPERRLYDLVSAEGPLDLSRLAQRLSLESREVGSAFGALSKGGLVGMNQDKQVELRSGSPEALEAVGALLAAFDGRESLFADELPPAQAELAVSLARKRGTERAMFRAAEREQVTYRVTPEGRRVTEALRRQGATGEEVGQITPELLRTGAWKQAVFRAYNIASPPQRVLAGRKNPYVGFLEDLKDKLTSLGFEEFDGPLLETEFWNSDALFMPQFHSARDIHDVYHLKRPTHAKAIEQPYLDQVAAAHENGWTTGSLGWRYRFDREFTRRMILRSQGTVLSAKQLTGARVPGKYFGVVRCFRYDRVDATHLADFYQTEGIVLGEEVNLRTLLGLLKMFAVEVAGAREFKFVPGYFPFTEPSVEAHIRHPQLGWFELGGSGIFRPEVTKPLGIEVPVLAWGLGIDRMALVAMGLNDLRDLFTADIEQVRLRRRK